MPLVNGIFSIVYFHMLALTAPVASGECMWKATQVSRMLTLACCGQGKGGRDVCGDPVRHRSGSH